MAVLAIGCRDATPLPESPEPMPIQQRFSGERPIRVVATVGMVADMVQQIGGEHVQVTVLCGPGVDPHLFKPTRDHVSALVSADLVVYAGLHLEGKLNDLLLRLSQRQAVFAVASGLPPERLILPDDQESVVVSDANRLSRAQIFESADPHVWMDTELWATATQSLADCLAFLDPIHHTAYHANAAAYRNELLCLHAYGVASMASVPTARRILVTSHDAFRYFGRAYEVRVEGVQGLATDSEAGLRRINHLVQLLSEKEVPAVFFESSISPKNMQALLEGVRARGGTTTLGSELYADALGPSDSTANHYVGMMVHNFDSIRRGLGGEDLPGYAEFRAKWQRDHILKPVTHPN